MKVEVDVKPTPAQIAEEFWMMDSDEQTEFFNHLATVQWKIDEQMKYVANNENLLDEAIMIMLSIGQSVANNRLQQTGKGGRESGLLFHAAAVAPALPGC